MNKCQILHETIVRDIIDTIEYVKDFDDVEWLNNKTDVGSIAKRADKLVLVFPVLVSSSLNIDTAMIISKAIERKCTSLLQILFSSIQFSDSAALQDYVKIFHTNLDTKRMDLGEFLDVMDKIVDEGGAIVVDRDKYDAVREDMNNINYMLSTEFNPLSINDYKVCKAYGESTVVLEKAKQPEIHIHNDIRTGGGNNNTNTNNKKEFPFNKDSTEYISKQLLSSDVKKANELMPTTMMISFTYTNKEGTKAVGRSTGVIGVKAKMYPVDSMDIINRLTTKVKDNNGLFNLIRASTREISFFKDLAFAIEKAKLDAMNVASDSNNAKMFRVLERRSAKHKLYALLKKNDASPITSLVLSQAEVEYMKQMNVDMEKSYFARTILEAYNLMDIVVADESLEIAKFLFDDGDGVYEAITFDALEKQASDNSYKKVVNLLSRVNR